MHLDKEFVRNLNPAISDRLRHGDLQRIAETVGLTPLSVRNAVNGATTNEQVIKEAIRLIVQDSHLTDEFLEQLPQALLNDLFAPS